MKAEKAYETKIKGFLKKHGVYCVKYFGCAFSQAGTPDLLTCINGKFVAIEVKSSDGKPSELQLHNLRQIDAAGGIAILAYPEDWDNLKALILALLNGQACSVLYDYFRWRFLD